MGSGCSIRQRTSASAYRGVEATTRSAALDFLDAVAMGPHRRLDLHHLADAAVHEGAADGGLGRDAAVARADLAGADDRVDDLFVLDEAVERDHGAHVDRLDLV